MSARINIKCAVTEKTNKREYVTGITTVLWARGQKYRSSIADERDNFSLPRAVEQI